MIRDRLAAWSVHWKLVAIALLVCTVALAVVVTGYTVFDAWQYRSRAATDVRSLAGILAENSAAAVTFDDRIAAEETLGSMRVRPSVLRACIYLDNGDLFAEFRRDADSACPSAAPTTDALLNVGATAAIVRNDRTWGTVYVERDLSEGLVRRVGMAASVALLVLLAAGVFGFILAERLTRSISGPIVRLATEARRFRVDEAIDVPDIPAGRDEVGDLVRAFRTMLVRVRDTGTGLRREIEQRKKVEAEREELLEREREANRLKDEFVATVAHELRTPLNAILGWTQILEATPPDEERLTKAIGVITRNVHAQARIIEDLVDVSRINTGKLYLRREVVDLRGPVEAAVDAARSETDGGERRIVAVLPDAPCPVSADPDRLRQVIDNLLSNAVKFSSPESQVVVSVHNSAETYELEVSDEGIGIPPDDLPHIFDRYRQSDSSTTRRHGGLGLGLSIVKEVTELHGGTVTAESSGVGKGASFRVRLPASSEASLNAVSREPEETSIPRLDGVRVLVVDDNADALDVLVEVLREAGAEVRGARSGAEAVEMFDADPPDVVLCDIAMPEMDGFAVLAEIRKRDERAERRTSAIAVSAHGSLSDRRRSLEAGFQEHVAKPYRVSHLAEVMKKVLNR